MQGTSLLQRGIEKTKSWADMFDLLSFTVSRAKLMQQKGVNTCHYEPKSRDEKAFFRLLGRDAAPTGALLSIN